MIEDCGPEWAAAGRNEEAQPPRIGRRWIAEISRPAAEFAPVHARQSLKRLFDGTQTEDSRRCRQSGAFQSFPIGASPQRSKQGSPEPVQADITIPAG